MSPEDGSCQNLRNYVYICWTYADKNCGLFFSDTVYIDGFSKFFYERMQYKLQ